MAFLTVNVGEVLLLRYILNNTTPGDVQLHLYTNNLTPAETDTLSMYTESTAGGYTTYALPGAAWTFATSAGTSTATYARQTFSYTTSETLYGYYLTNENFGGGQQLIWAERFSTGPFTLPGIGGTIDIDPKIGLD